MIDSKPLVTAMRWRAPVVLVAGYPKQYCCPAPLLPAQQGCVSRIVTQPCSLVFSQSAVKNNTCIVNNSRLHCSTSHFIIENLRGQAVIASRSGAHLSPFPSSGTMRISVSIFVVPTVQYLNSMTCTRCIFVHTVFLSPALQ